MKLTPVVKDAPKPKRKRQYRDVRPQDRHRIAACLLDVEEAGWVTQTFSDGKEHTYPRPPEFNPVFTKVLRKRYPRYAAAYDAAIAAWEASDAGMALADWKDGGRRKNATKVLGVPLRATPKEIKSAYRRLARMFHPDVNRDGAAKMTELNEAYAALETPTPLL